MLGNISNLILVVCLAASVAGSALVRNKRQWDDLDINTDPYGHCGKPTTPIPNGGIKLFPVTDFDDPHDNSCNFREHSFLLCEPKFYCDDGYVVDGDFHLQCVHNELTDEYEWEGNIPTCVKQNYSLSTVIAVVSFIGVTIIVIIAGAIRRKTRNSRARCVTRTTTVVIPQSSTASNGRPMVTGGPPGYTRFDDSNIQVPRDGTTPHTQGK